MKVNWGVLPIFAAAIVGAVFLFAYHGPHPEYVFISYFILIFSLFFWNGWRTALLKRRLRKEGLQGTARLLKTDTTGMRSGNDPELDLTLAVTGQDGDTWDASVRQIIPQTQLYAMAPGTMFSILYDPHDKSKVVLDNRQQSSAANTSGFTNANVSVTTTVSLQPQPVSKSPGDAGATMRAYQDMMAKQAAFQTRLAETGTLAPAKVLTCVPLNATMNNKDPLLLLMLEVQPEYEAPFSGQVAGCFDSTRLDRFAPGCQVYVRYDPADLSQIALVGSERPV